MRARLWQALTCAILLTGRAPASPSEPASVSVVAPGEELTDALRQALGKRFALAGSKVAFSAWDGSLVTLQEREAAGQSEPDVVLIEEAAALAACREGLLVPLDRTAVGLPATAGGINPDLCGVPAFETSLVLAWDKVRDTTTPGWPDFWDVARSPGKRGLPRCPRGTLEIALMADGVAPGDVYRVLASPGGIDRAFHKLDQLRPYVVWWADGAAARKALASGQVRMTAAPPFWQPGGSPAIGQQWIEALADKLSWVVPKGAPDPDGAWQFLRLQAQPSWQSAVTELVPVVGLASGVEATLSPDLLARTAAAPHRAERMLAIDDAFWRDHPELSGRFEVWLAQPR